jgi:Alpha/beta hydrolase family
MATFVLVHGGAHGGWCYQRVARILRAAGNDVYTPTMTGVGERTHLVSADVDLDLHIRDIAAVLHYEDLRDVILVRLTNEAAMLAIPRYHIVCTSTLTSRDPELVANARAEGRLWDINTGHDLMMTEPEAVADRLLRVASDQAPIVRA